MSKHTPGPYENTGIKLFAGTNAVSSTREIVNICAADYKTPTEEDIANGVLVTEAFMVAAETGLTPRQLAEQRQELLEALKEAEDYMSGVLSDEDERLIKVRTAIAMTKAEARA